MIGGFYHDFALISVVEAEAGEMCPGRLRSIVVDGASWVSANRDQRAKVGHDIPNQGGQRASAAQNLK